MNETKLNFCLGMSEAFRLVWFDLSCAIELSKENSNLRDWLTIYKDQTHTAMNKWLDKAAEALEEDIEE